MSFHIIRKEIKEQILHRIKNEGIPVSQVASEHGISPKTVYTWLSAGVASTSVSILEVSRLRRENKVLMEMVGRLTMEKQKQSFKKS
jgi:transposase-like protein